MNHHICKFHDCATCTERSLLGENFHGARLEMSEQGPGTVETLWGAALAAHESGLEMHESLDSACRCPRCRRYRAGCARKEKHRHENSDPSVDHHDFDLIGLEESLPHHHLGSYYSWNGSRYECVTLQDKMELAQKHILDALVAMPVWHSKQMDRCNHPILHRPQ